MTDRAEVVTAYRHLATEGLIEGTAGNISARTERGMVITPSSIPPHALDEDGLCDIDFATGLVSAGRPSSEWMLHLEVYRTHDVGAIVHTHSLAATAVSLLVDELPAVHYYIARLGGPVPILPYTTYGTEELAALVGAGLQGRSAVILANHGAVTVGGSLDEAVERASLLEWLAELYLKAASVGAPRALGPDDLAAVRAQPARTAARGYRLG